MRNVVLLASAVLANSLLAQTTVTVSTGPNNASQKFHSLQNGEQGSAPLNEWDLAFEIIGFSSSILVNTAKGLVVYETPAAISDWSSVNVPDPDNWTLLHNSETDWSSGALTNGNNLSEPDGFNVGWGIYNIITHTIAGNKIYVIDDGQGYYRKLRINALQAGVYSFTYADLDGSNEHQGSVNKTQFAQRNFAYWSMSTHASMDREPATGTWDLLFTKYIGFVPEVYALTGVLQNKEIETLQVDGVPTSEANAWSGPYSIEINTIGADWKTFNMTTFQYEYAEDRTYFVKDHEGSIWKLVFTGYGGSSNGDVTFTQELVSATSIGEIGSQGTVLAYPNPVSDGRLLLVMDGMDPVVDRRIFDANGRLVAQDRMVGQEGIFSRIVDVSDLPNGLYSIHLRGPMSAATTRFVVGH